MVNISIVVGSKITNILNLSELVKYANERGIKTEIVKTIEDAKGKYIFEYCTDNYYFDYCIHWAFLRLEMPIGYNPGDPDLPEKMYWNKSLVCDGNEVGFDSNRYCDFYLRKSNKYNNFIEETSNIGRCVRGRVEKGTNIDSSTKKLIMRFFRD